jgi:hypothetical protein
VRSSDRCNIESQAAREKSTDIGICEAEVFQFSQIVDDLNGFFKIVVTKVDTSGDQYG